MLFIQIFLYLALLSVDMWHGVYLCYLIPGEKNGLFPAALLAVTAILVTLTAALLGAIAVGL